MEEPTIQSLTLVAFLYFYFLGCDSKTSKNSIFLPSSHPLETVYVTAHKIWAQSSSTAIAAETTLLDLKANLVAMTFECNL